MPKIVYILITSLVLMTNSYALQIKSIKDNQAITAKISSKELSRIFVNNDRIQATRGINGAYELMKDEKQGMIFIKPSPYFIGKSFNLFITTEKGHTYNLLLVSMNIPSETIELKPLTPVIRLANKWEKNSPYVELLIQLINGMVNKQYPEGYAVIPVDGKVAYFPSFTMKLIKVYRGSKLQGEIWKIKNCTHSSIVIKPNEFFNKYTRAISLQDESLAVGSETYLYKVNDND